MPVEYQELDGEAACPEGDCPDENEPGYRAGLEQ
jgi:hypothetical protein